MGRRALLCCSILTGVIMFRFANVILSLAFGQMACTAFAQTTAKAESSDTTLIPQQVIRLFANLGDDCQLQADPEKAQDFTIKRYVFSHAAEGSEDATQYYLFSASCWLGAYNEGTAWALSDASENAPPRLLSFAEPTIEFEYENPDDPVKVLDFQITGYKATTTLVLSDFDPDELEISAHTKWRGLGDASSTGNWKFDGRDFVLRLYQADPTYDGEPQSMTIIDFTRETP